MLRIATASALLWPWLRMGLLPPVESIRISDQSIPVLINTEATLVMGMLSSELPKNRGLIRNTRSGPTSIRVGKSRLPRVQRLAVKTLLAVDVRGAVDMSLFYLAGGRKKAQCAFAGLFASASCNAFFLRRLRIKGRRLRRSTRLSIFFQKPQK
jgi:hypothetical protein